KSRWARGSIRLTPRKETPRRLNGARTVRRRAEDSAGKPLAGIEFIPWTVHKKNRLDYCNLSGAALLRGAAVKTDKDGVATFDWIPHDIDQGTTFLSHSTELHEPNSAHFDVSVPDKPLTTRLLRQATMGGKVALPDGKPAGGVLLQVEGRGETNHYFRSVVRTKPDGSWTLSVYPNQTYVIAVTSEDWAAKSRKDVGAKEDDKITGLDFRL